MCGGGDLYIHFVGFIGHMQYCGVPVFCIHGVRSCMHVMRHMQDGGVPGCVVVYMEYCRIYVLPIAF